MEERANGFLVSFAKTTQKTTQKIIMDCLKENPRFTRTALAVIIGKSESTIKEHLAALKKAGLIKRDGSDRGGVWQVVDE